MFDPTQAGEPITARRGFFWVGVQPAEQAYGTIVAGQMYVQWEAPVDVRHPHPVVLVHGGGGQGTDWLGTPDGRPGWATYLVQEGYVVYVVDRPGHGRSPFHPDALGAMTPPIPYEFGLGLFANPDSGQTQWPGALAADDAALGQVLAAGGPMLADTARAHALEQERLAELLDLIGPAIVVSHSAGGPAGWLVADARPELVRALVQVEAVGPPFLDDPTLGISLTWGLTAAPLTYDPPASSPDELRTVVRDPFEPGGIPVTLQADPPRALRNLARVPIALVTSEASAFRAFDRHTVAFLEQAGATAELLRLEDHGVRGNGHGMMLERNNREALGPILDWLAEHAEGGVPAAAGERTDAWLQPARRGSANGPSGDRMTAEPDLTATVVESFDGAQDPRYREVIESLVRHLHAFARDVDLTEDEYFVGIDFLTRTGQISSPARQEFVLLADVLGLSMLTVGLGNRKPPEATEATVFGPFFVEDSPLIDFGGDMSNGAPGQPCLIRGRITDTAGNAIPGARIEAWQSDEDGFYDVQKDGIVGPQNRGHLFSQDDGSFAFWAVKPVAYPIPYDGPVGELLTAGGRGPMRPAHVHFMVTADGFARLITHIFASGDAHLENDAVFGVKSSLIADFVERPAGLAPDGRMLDETYALLEHDLVLATDDEAAEATARASTGTSKETA